MSSKGGVSGVGQLWLTEICVGPSQLRKRDFCVIIPKSPACSSELVGDWKKLGGGDLLAGGLRSSGEADGSCNGSEK